MQVRLLLLKAVGRTLAGLSKRERTVVSLFLEENIGCGCSADGGSLDFVRALPIQFANFGHWGSWDCSGFLSPYGSRKFRSGRPGIPATDVSSVVELDEATHSPSVDGQQDVDAARTGPRSEEDSGSPDRESDNRSEIEVGRKESTGGGLPKENESLGDSVVEEIRQRIARRKSLAAEYVAGESPESIVEELRDKVAGKRTELDVAERVLKQAFEILDADGYVPEIEQRSLSVAVVGATNAGKSALTNQLVGSKVSAVSRKTNTTHADHLGVYTEGDTQLVIYDTAGLTIDTRGYPIRSSRVAAVMSAWQMTETCDALAIVVDAHRQIARADTRVERLVRKLAEEDDWEKKRVLCLNKVDLITDKKALLPLADKFCKFAHFDRVFMISSESGSGVKDVRDYLVDKAILRKWEYEPNKRTQRLQQDLAMEVVREHLYNRMHAEVPYAIEHYHVSWQTRMDGSIRIEQHLVVQKKDHKKIVVGKCGALIRQIGMGARLDLQKLLDREVHLILDVRTKAAYPAYEDEVTTMHA